LAPNLGIELEQYGFTSGTYGAQYETNLFGSYTACCVIMFSGIVRSERRARQWYGWGFAITLVAAIIISSHRGDVAGIHLDSDWPAGSRGSNSSAATA
jgi:hypothetical protein